MAKPQKLSRAFLFATYGEDVLTLLGKDRTARKAFSPVIARKIRDHRKGKLAFASHEEFMAEIVTPVMEAFLGKACPSAQGKLQHQQWVVKKYLAAASDNKPLPARDLPAIDENLKYFDSLKNSPAFKETGASADLLSYKTYAAFEEMLAPHLQRKAEQEKTRQKFNVASDVKASILAETTILYDGPEGRVVVPHTPKASKYWGRNTKWCLSGEDGYSAERMFPGYDKKSPVIMILPQGQADNKAAVVNHLVYNSADDSMKKLPEVHQALMNKCLQHASKGVREGIIPWLKNVMGADRSQHLEVTAATADKEIKRLSTYGRRLAIDVQGRMVEETYPLNTPVESLWASRDFVLAIVKKQSAMLEHASAEFRDDPEIVLAAIGDKYVAAGFEFASPRLKADRNFVMKAVNINGAALGWADEKLRHDPEIAMAAVRNNGLALATAPESFRNDPEIVMTALRTCGRALAYAEAFQDNEAFVRTAVMQSGEALKDASPRLQDDYQTVLAAVTQDGLALRHASARLKANPAIVLAAVQQDGGALGYVKETFGNNREIVMTAVQQKGWALQNASSALQDDFDIAYAAISNAPNAFYHISDKLKDDPRILVLAADESSYVVNQRRDLMKDKKFVREWLATSPTLAFDMDRYKGLIWKPRDKELAEWQKKALPRLAATGDAEAIQKYTRFAPAAWGDADMVFGADPAAAARLSNASAPESRTKRFGHAMVHALTFGRR